MARRRVTPQSVAEQHVISGTDQTAMLDVKYINPTKGRGVFALLPFQKRDFVVEYRGQLIDLEESERRRRIYNAKCLGFMFDFMWHGKKWCIDAAMEDGSLGRLVNDDHVHPNCRMKRILVGRKPHLCLFAVRDIHSGEEITYDYGDDNWPWREKADGDSPDEAVENPVMQQEEVLPPSLQGGSGDSFVKDLENSSFVCSSSMVLQDKKVFEKAKSTLVTYSDSSESAISSSTKEDVPPSTMQSKEKIPFGLDLSDSSMKHGDDDARQMIVPRLRRTKSIFMKENIPDGSEELFDTSPDSGEEYVPVSSGESTDESTICETLPPSLSEETPKSKSRATPCQSSSRSSATKVFTPDSTCSPSRGCGESTSVSIPGVRKKEDGSRMYNKKQFCLYCGSSFLKISTHLERKHNKEVEVAKALSFPKGSKQRRVHLESLRNKGNFAHNTEVLRTGKGKLVARKQPRENSQAKDYMHCVYCQGLFRKRAMWRHVQICHLKPDIVNPKPGKTRVQALCAFAEPTPAGISEELWKLVNNMNQDVVAHAVKSDWCIMELGKHLYNKHGSDLDKHEYIRQKLRELGRLRVHGGEVTNMKTIREYLIPANFMQTVNAVKHTAQSNKSNAKSLPLKLGHSLKKMSMLLESDAIIKGDKDATEAARSFRNIYDAKWHELVSATSLKSLSESKWNAPQLLPFTADVQKLHNYLDEKQKQYQHDLESEASSQNWASLAKVTLAQVILFNRRREGEVSKMSLSAFTSRDRSAPHEDVNLALSELEKKLCHHFTRIEMRGKRGRKVAVLLSPAMQEALDVLHQKRNECGVLKENAYVFARPGAMSHYRGSDCIRQFVQSCGVKNPLSLTSTRLRKQMATLSKVLNLQETELDQLADFMGHDIRVHRQFYRLPEGTLQLVKISKILMAMEQGRLAEFQGKSLEQITIDPNETIQLDKHPESEDELAEVACEQDMEVPDMSQPQKRKWSDDSDGDDMPLQKTKSKTARKPQKRRPWEKEEMNAVERHMISFIHSCRVPGKDDCDRCLKSEPEALKNRDWKAIKFYIKNRITALKRKA
ncbi:uncharacterized protein LOC129412454 isoform X2 [Boleophthalmus pectinirostris]|uniref:uncharacterized protein LOC129412454 isoform X2 n=1 Tax=Boleophthalmus pectinirostris TaxID=150288 RepID=UPI00242DCA80|nr:uncharacterized protein LOC129412454 isoform X2 [Boleophthalmus pectinirostris]